MSQFELSDLRRRFVAGDWVLPVLLIALLLAFIATKPALGAEATGKRESTFVGNGGNAQDLELAAALAVVNVTAAAITEDNVALCGCPDKWSENDLCRVLRDMSEPEKKTCREVLLKHKDELAKLSARDSDVTFDWSEQPILAKDGAAAERSVDAVTQPEKQKVIINRARFYDLPVSFRVALLTHELMHLVKHNGQTIDDNAPMPPFKNGRSLLDGVGAAVAVQANDNGSISTGAKLQRVSKSRKNHWFDINLGSVQEDSKNTKERLKSGVSSYVSSNYIWRPDRLGFQLGANYQQADNRPSLEYGRRIDLVGEITVSEVLAIYTLGVDYKINPINRYLSRWNELYVTVFGNVGKGDAHYRVSDGDVTLSDQAEVICAGSGVKLYLPLVKGFWLTADYGLRHVRYEYKTLGIKVIENQQIWSFGGVYGF